MQNRRTFRIGAAQAELLQRPHRCELVGGRERQARFQSLLWL